MKSKKKGCKNKKSMCVLNDANGVPSYFVTRVEEGSFSDPFSCPAGPFLLPRSGEALTKGVKKVPRA